MARINIEDSLYKDGRFTDLCIALRSRRTALGALVEAWTLAQEFVTPENSRGLVTREEWADHRIADEIIDCGLARVDEISGHIYMIGAEEAFSWLVTAQIKGRKGGKKKAENKEKFGTVQLSPASNSPSSARKQPPESYLSLPSYSSSSLPAQKSPQAQNLEVTNKIAPEPARQSSGWKVSQVWLDSVYAIYPRKKGKAEGMKKLEKLIKNEQDLEMFITAAENFSEAMRAEGRPADKIPYFSTWINEGQWKDYVNPEEDMDFSGQQSTRDPWEQAALFLIESVRDLSPGSSSDKEILESRLPGALMYCAVRMTGGLGVLWKLAREEKGKQRIAALLKQSAERQQMADKLLDSSKNLKLVGSYEQDSVP